MTLPSQEDLIKAVDQVLENPFSIPELGGEHIRVHDDHDGSFDGTLVVTVAPNSDICIRILSEKRGKLLRYRDDAGGGKSLRVRNALMILAYAIKLDNEERPLE